MRGLRFSLAMVGAVFRVLFRRATGRKEEDTWGLGVELAWATTRAALLSTKTVGFPWFQRFSTRAVRTPKRVAELTVETRELGGHSFLDIAPRTGDSRGRIVYLHGGGYVMGSPEAGLGFSSKLAANGFSVWAPRYPLAPSNPYPGAHEVAHSFVSQVLNECDPSELIIGGGSAGAALALSAVSALDPSIAKRLKGVLLISPWVEPLVEGGSVRSNEMRDVGDRDFLVRCYHTYLDRQEQTQPYWVDFTDLEVPQLREVLVAVGTRDVLFDQSERMAQRLESRGAVVDFRTYDTMFHAFWNVPQIPAADTLVEDIGKWAQTLS